MVTAQHWKPRAGSRMVSGSGRNGNEAVATSEAFARWLHHRQGPISPPVELQLAGGISFRRHLGDTLFGSFSFFRSTPGQNVIDYLVQPHLSICTRPQAGWPAGGYIACLSVINQSTRRGYPANVATG